MTSICQTRVVVPPSSPCPQVATKPPAEIAPNSQEDIPLRAEHERVDQIPLVSSLLIEMGMPGIIDQHYTPHGNHQSLSVGWLATIFLAYIITESNHKMVTVQKWANKHRRTLEVVTGKTILPTDFADDRLGDVLRYLSQDELWWAIEKDLGQQTIRVYELDQIEIVRLDPTVGKAYHNEKKHTIFKKGRNKDGVIEVQFKMMLGVLDALGLPLAADVVSGDTTDDPLYVPIYHRIRETLGKVGLLYIGDCKMGALETRGTIVDGGDFYLSPLAMTGNIPDLLDEQLDEVMAGEIEPAHIFQPEDLPTDSAESPDPELSIARGFEIEREQETILEDGTVVTWTERLGIVQSKAFAEVREKAWERRIAKAIEEIEALTPLPGQRKRQFREETPLREAVDKILDHYRVVEYLDIRLERRVTTKKIRAYRDRPARTEEQIRYQVHVARREQIIAQAKQRLGWRMYATNTSQERLNLTAIVLAYRDQYIAERPFARLKGAILNMLPLYVQLEKHALGMIRLLTVALRVLIVLEFVVRRSLAEKNETLSGIYDGNPKRSTAWPSAELLLRAFEDITSTTLWRGDCLKNWLLTPLNEWQVRILALLHIPISIYTQLVVQPFD